jgi:hypothetical protein
MEYFIKHIIVTKDKPILLLDNHHSDLSLRMLEFAKENGAVLLSFPPHTTYKLNHLYSSRTPGARLRINPEKF